MAFANRSGQSRKSIETELGITLKKLVPGLRRTTRRLPDFGLSDETTVEPYDGQVREVETYDFPSLDECRQAFDEAMGWQYPWPETSAAKRRPTREKESYAGSYTR